MEILRGRSAILTTSTASVAMEDPAAATNSTYMSVANKVVKLAETSSGLLNHSE
jgi:hypothetical protein